MSDIVRQTARRAAAAAGRIRDYVVRTPLEHSAAFSELCAARVFFKREDRQGTGSFKLRGATNRVLTLGEEQRAGGCVAASSGNHGAAVACALEQVGGNGIIFVPEGTSTAKTGKICKHGGDVRYFGTDGLDTEQHARDYARENDMFYLSPYNDEEVIAGQGSCGIELLEQLPDLDAVFVAVGGGGLVGGVGAVLKAHNPEIRVYGCQPAASPVMARSIAAGEIVDMPSEPTLSDGTAGGIEAGAITFPLCRAVVDEWVEVTEDEIAAAMRVFIDSERQPIEGAAGVAIAALLARREDVVDKNVAVIICGGNVSEEVLQSVRGRTDGG